MRDLVQTNRARKTATAAQVEARHREIARRYAQRSRQQQDLLVPRLRPKELRTLALHWFPDGRGDFELPETNRGRQLALQIIAHSNRRIDWVFRFCHDHAPWLDPDEIDLAGLRCATADDLGKLIELTAIERDELKIKTIGPCDQTRAERKAARKARRRTAERKRRLDKGGMPRLVHELMGSLSTSKPWEAEGISRRTWYRKRRHDGTSPCRIERSGTTGHAVVPRRSPRRPGWFVASVFF